MKEVLRVYWFLLFLFLVTSLAHGQVRRDSASRIRFGNAVPATCNPDIGQVFFLIAPGSPLGLHQCLVTDTWTPAVSTMTGAGAANQVAFFTAPTDLAGDTRFRFSGGDVLIGSPTTISLEPDGTAAFLNVNMNADDAVIAFGANQDAQIHRGDGTDILEQRRGANSQKWNIYDNFTSFADYDRLGIYIGGGPPVISAIIRPESTDATQGINILIESLANAFGDGAVTLLAGTSGARLSLQPSSSGSSAQFTGGGNFSFGNDIFLTGLISSVGVNEVTPGVGLLMTIASVAAPGFRDSHSIDLLGRGGGASSATWRTFVDILNIGADSIYTLQTGPTGGPFVDVLTIDDSSDVVIADSTVTVSGPLASFATLVPTPSTPIVGLLLGTVPLTSANQRDSDSIIWMGQAHDGAVARSSRWQWFVDITNNSGAGPFTLQHSAAGQAFGDELRIFTSGEVNIPDSSGALTWGVNRDTRLRPDGPNELALVSSTSGTIPQQFNVYNNNMGSQFSSEYGRLDWISVPGTFVVGTAKGINAGSARPMALQTDELNALVIDISQNVTITNDLVVSGAGPHAIAGAAFGAVQLLISDTFTSDGASNIAAGLFHTPTIVGAAGDTVALTGTTLTSAITTQTATESIANIAQLQVNEPTITDNLTGLITQASTVLITGAPTEGVSNDALRVADGRVFLGGQTIVDHDSSASFIVRKDGDAGDVLSVNTVSDIVRIDGRLVVVGTGASAFGSAFPMTPTSAFTIDTTFTAGATGTSANALDFFPDFTGASGHTTALNLMRLAGNLQTQAVAEVILNVSTLSIAEPSITLGAGSSISMAHTVFIEGAPTEGVSNFALRIASGRFMFGGDIVSFIGNGPAILHQAGTTTVPNILPHSNFTNAGVSVVDAEGSQSMHLIVEGIDIMNLSPARVNVNLTNTFEINGALFVDGNSDIIQMRVDAHSTQNAFIFRARDSSAATIMTIADNGRVEGGAGSAWGLMNEGATTTNPTILTNRNDTNTGLGGNSTAVSIIVSSVSRFHATTTGIGFNSVTPIARPTYGVENVVTDRDYDANSTTLDEIADVLGTLIADLVSYGLLTSP